MMTLHEFNAAPVEDARRLLVHACHCTPWVEAMLAERPFADREALYRAAARHWQRMNEAAMLEAFLGHARIGDLAALRDRFAPAAKEQGQVAEAEEPVLAELLSLNRAYEARHGFMFIVCASGKSAAAMRDLLRERLPNDRATELANAAREQAAITRLRLDGALASKETP
ncbi:2-oxo-4-hydroxy-4-carboxy-5-ureidoimidazoline decarboxylase [Pseudohaliea rubra]|uniref:2-oxo-4-hydroxy-4-carboxy-5-ureidoimidazoline decarboxylase n=1 Tax=Pseudohaliea rubra DSM 19751 TaxID=1265313 RepID=A0A095VQF7_9GAMM|nr:2-oxo-4-hydroxy-4-carboxy-5-ureidoimidazoline decarboxylase [Pseudohaliea rubra]KGE03677.1 2-oxo-4-hydroxy-4-carboxy--5-ureidoimidazoline (OHCU) decarboxylase [Pseudohaliea rubra DSM 19751]